MLFDATMENATCHVIYVNRKVREDRLIRAQSKPLEISNGVALDGESGDVGENLQVLLEAFNDGTSARPLPAFVCLF
jgi:hypothetical protein